MANNFEFPDGNLEQFVPSFPERSEIYHTVHFNTDLFQRSIPRTQKYNQFRNEKCAQYFQLKQFTDPCGFQFALTNYTSIQLYWQKSDGTYIFNSAIPTGATIAGDLFDADGSIPPEQQYRVQYNFNVGNDLTVEGFYLLELRITFIDGEQRTMISEPYWVKKVHADTVAIQCSHNQNDNDIYWDMGLSTCLRLPANLLPTGNKLDLTKFRNQTTDLRQLYGRNWKTYLLKIGSFIEPYGIAPYHINKLAQIQMCSNVYLDGKRMIMEDGADFEPIPYGDNYPVSTINIQFVDFYSKSRMDFTSGATLKVYESGDTRGYPWAVSFLYLYKIYGAGAPLINLTSSYPNGIKEILNSSDETAFVTQLNTATAAAGGTGTWSKTGGFIQYKNGVSESYVQGTLALRDALKVKFTADGITKIGIRIVASDAQTVVITSAWDIVGTPVNKRIPTQYGYLDSTIDVTVNNTSVDEVYIYHNNIMDELYLDGITGVNSIIEVTGSIMSGITQGIELQNYTIGTLDPSFLIPARQNIQSFNFRRGTATAINMNFLNRIIPSDWQKLTYLGFSINKLNTAGQNNVYNSVFTKSFVASNPIKFQIDTRAQVPSSLPDGGSSAQRAIMTGSGNFMNFV